MLGPGNGEGRACAPSAGEGTSEVQEGRVLNRVIRWTDEGMTYEADPRQHEKLISELGLEGAKAVVTPVVRPSPEALAADMLGPASLLKAGMGPYIRYMRDSYS